MFRQIALIAVAVVAMGRAVSAQPEPQQPGRSYRGLFGAGLERTNQALTIDATLSGGYDNNVLTAEAGSTGPEAASTGAQASSSVKTGTFEQASVGLGYRLKVTRVSLDAHVNGSASNYSTRREPLVRSYRGDVSASLPLWSGAQLALNQTVAVRPFYFLPGLSGATPEEESLGATLFDETAGAIVETHTSSSSSAALSQALTRRVSLSLDYLDQRNRSSSGARDLRASGGTAGLNVTIGKGLGLRLGYGMSENRYDTGQAYQTRNVDAGLNFNRALSLTRRTRLGFNTGTTAIVVQGRAYYRLDANARLSRELARTWTAQIVYNRDVSFDETFRQPMPIDSLSLSAAGLFSRRLGFHSSIGSVRGRLGLGSLGNGFETYYGRSGLLVGLSRVVGLGLDYSYFQYRFDSQSGLPSGLFRRADRQRVRAFVTLRAALFKARNKGAR